ncbi:hypothetical protein [Azovibrio restrictus]|uniref:hypothetical protein n=1 Tax=Azovibrio restrictus TaxID=146938 RepID=UPI0026F1C7FE|nr:hypothetical protein [Azovibrio restrictus]
MQFNFKARDWHNWTSVILAIPLLIVGLTSIFLAHKKELKLNELDLTSAVSWLPGYGNNTITHPRTEIRASLMDTDGSQWIGTQAGLYRMVAGRSEAIKELGDAPVRDLVRAPWGLVVATKYGIWVLNEQGWSRPLKGDAWNASLGQDGQVAVSVKDQGLLLSRDGLDWQPAEGVAASLAALPPTEAIAERITLGKLMIDLHTGKAFFGKNWEWVWIDILGAIWGFLGFTGLYLWWRSQTKRRDAARGKLLQEAQHG